MPDDQPKPRIGPFAIPVPPPSSNGSHVSHGGIGDALRRAVPGLVAGLVLSLTTVPVRALVHTSDLALWWRIALVCALAGAASGAGQRRARVAAVAGGAVATAGLLLSYTVVPSRFRVAAGATAVIADIARLVAWGVVVGAAFGAAAWLVRSALMRRGPAARRLGRAR